MEAGNIERSRGRTSWERGKVADTVIAKVRYQLGMTQVEFAKECNICSTAQVSHYESGKTVPSIKTALNVIRVAKRNGIDITLDDFYEGDI